MEKNDAKSVFEAGLLVASRAPIRIGDGVPYAVVPEGCKLVDLEAHLDRPVRKCVTVSLSDIGSFVAYLADHKARETRVFANVTETGGCFEAVLDYHGKEPDWCGHRAVYAPPSSPEWKRWIGKNAALFTQEEFARFLEDNLPDIVEPVGAEMLEIALTLEAKSAVAFSSGVRLDNGNQQLVYEETTAAKAGEKGSLTVPSKFVLGIPVFLNGEKYQVEVRLRYRIREKTLVFVYEIVRPHAIIKDACDQVVKTIREQAEVPVWMGSLS